MDQQGGRLTADAINVHTTGDFTNLGGQFKARDVLKVKAEGNFLASSTLRDATTQGSRHHSVTELDQQAGFTVTGPGAYLGLSTAQAMTLQGVTLSNTGPDGYTSLNATGPLHLGTLNTHRSDTTQWDPQWDPRNSRHTRIDTEHGTRITANGDIQLNSGQDINLRAATLHSTQGTITTLATGTITITHGDTIQYTSQDSHSKRSGFLNSRTTTTHADQQQTQAIGSTLSADKILIKGNNITVTGSNVVSDAGTYMQAEHDLTLQAATHTTQSTYSHHTKQRGFIRNGGTSLTLGNQSQRTDSTTTTTTTTGSLIGATNGNVTLLAGGHYQQIGSDVLSPNGDIDIHAKKVDIIQAHHTSQTTEHSATRQSGLTVGLSTPLIAGAQTAQQMQHAAARSGDPRLHALAGLTTALGAKNTIDAVRQDPRALGGLNASLTVGRSTHDSTTTTTTSTAAGSNVTAGGNVRISATGDGNASSITIQGSDVRGDNMTYLKADGDIALLAAANTTTSDRQSRGCSAGVGVAVNLGSGGTSAGLTAHASTSTGSGQSTDVTWSNSHVGGGNLLAIEAGGDVLMQGAIGTAKQVIADIAGNLRIESLQDTHHYRSTDRSLGGSLTVGAGFSGSANLNNQTIRSDYASVTEQSGLFTGDGGYQLTVGGQTHLIGGAITSNSTAIHNGLNTLDTGTLILQDIENHATYTATQVNLGGGYSRNGGTVGTDQQGHAATATQVPGTTLPSHNGLSASPPSAMTARDSSHSTTYSGISQGALTIRDPAAQHALTGHTAAETIAGLNRDILTDTATSNALKPIFDEQRINAGFDIVSGLQRETGTFLNNRAAEADLKTRQATAADHAAHDPTNGFNDQQRQTLRDQAIALTNEAHAIKDAWGPGGTYRQITTALAAGASGNVSAASSDLAKHMIVNYVQQQGASAIGHWVATGQLTEGSLLHAALHALLACAGAAASQQHCSSGAQGAAASSVLTGLFSAPRPEDTAQDREAKRNLITSIVTGIASIGNTDPATATHAAIAAVDNNWLATQQKLQMENELKAARQKGFWAEEAVKAKWDAISAKQDILTTSTLLLGLAESAKSDLNGLVELVLHPIDTVNGLKALITDPAVRQQLGERLVQELNERVDRIQANTIFGGDLDALEYGRGLGTVVWDVGSLLVGVGGVAKGGELLAKAGINVSEDVLERMATSKANQLSKADAIASARELNNFYLDGGFPYVLPNEIRTSSGIVIRPNPDKTTTVLGTFLNDTNRIINEDLFLSKSMIITGPTQPGAFNGTFNLLNTPDRLYNLLGPEKFWEQVNKPFLDGAIKRGDDIVLATKPEERFLNRLASDGSGRIERTGFGREYDYLIGKGYVYDASSGMMKKVKK
ncbi:hemagglutinin repeat-containing protein [Xylella fastidiosa]|uniref:hemagglutinin repeat-containing protein n=3 Tax=Xylella fastidiosa TaxID=2371 RepID=UPI003CCEF770